MKKNASDNIVKRVLEKIWGMIWRRRKQNDSSKKEVENEPKEIASVESNQRDMKVDSNENYENTFTLAVVETGWLMMTDMREIYECPYVLAIPQFCIWELQNLSNCRERKKIRQILKYVQNKNNKNVIIVNLHKKEPLKIEPTYEIKKRSRGIVAVCCQLWNEGFEIKLFTSSREVKQLAEEQCINIDVWRQY